MATTNRGYIFDMVPGQSLVEYLLDAGFDVFMLDWEAPRADEKTLTLDSYVLDFLPDRGRAGGARRPASPTSSVVGYCFGGVLSLLWAALEGATGGSPTSSPSPRRSISRAMEMFQAWADRALLRCRPAGRHVRQLPGRLSLHRLRHAAPRRARRAADPAARQAAGRRVRQDRSACSTAGPPTSCRWRASISARPPSS